MNSEKKPTIIVGSGGGRNYYKFKSVRNAIEAIKRLPAGSRWFTVAGPDLHKQARIVMAFRKEVAEI